ncbi:hypothetical protein Lal_00011604 [Lupinus albus]|nr:hypothetical protein Lal_00011604 [Lupinus albus]
MVRVSPRVGIATGSDGHAIWDYTIQLYGHDWKFGTCIGGKEEARAFKPNRCFVQTLMHGLL